MSEKDNKVGWSLCSTPKDEADPKVRQVNVSLLNESVNLVSTYPKDSMVFLRDMALDILRKVKDGK